jgi:hypothetical protein
VALRAGAPAEVVPAASTLTRDYPLREEGWRLLAVSLWAQGRQGDALGALRQARKVLDDELGIDPGPALTELEDAILQQRTDLLRAALAPPASAPASHRAEVAATSEVIEPRDSGEVFIGREMELAALSAAAQAAGRGPGGLVLVTGEAGVGKSALLAIARGRLTAAGWLTVAGSCPETNGAPPAWAWVQALRELARTVPPEGVPPVTALLDVAHAAVPAPGTDTSAGRFRLHHAVATWLRAAAEGAPLAVILDDMHNADEESRALLETLATGLAGHPVLLVAAYRPDDADGRLDDLLATLARRTPLRLGLSGLPPADVAALVRAVHSGQVADKTMVALA